MNLTHSQMDAGLQKLYDRIPAIPDCTGRCWISCGVIDMSDRERQRIRQAGYRITPAEQAVVKLETYWCEALTAGKRCAVYDLRPLACRLWGAVENMKCPYGCIPEGGWMSADEAYRLIVESCRIGGHPDAITASAAELARVMNSDLFRSSMAERMQIGAAGDRLRMQQAVPPAFRRKENLNKTLQYRQVKCSACGRAYRCTPADDYYGRTPGVLPGPEDGVCLACLLADHDMDVQKTPIRVLDVDGNEVDPRDGLG